MTLYSPNFLEKSWSTTFLSLVILAYQSSFTVCERDTEQNTHSLHLLKNYLDIQCRIWYAHGMKTCFWGIFTKHWQPQTKMLQMGALSSLLLAVYSCWTSSIHFFHCSWTILFKWWLITISNYSGDSVILLEITSNLVPTLQNVSLTLPETWVFFATGVLRDM